MNIIHLKKNPSFSNCKGTAKIKWPSGKAERESL
jgi:hypothetical protein